MGSHQRGNLSPMLGLICKIKHKLSPSAKAADSSHPKDDMATEEIYYIASVALRGRILTVDESGILDIIIPL